MAPPALLSPAQLSYLHTSLSLQPPIRPDARTPTTFRPLRVETDILIAANGSARVCFADGSEAIVGVRAEVEKTILERGLPVDEDREAKEGYGGDDGWVEVGIEVSGQQGKDEEGFWGEMLREGLLGDGKLRERLVINRRWHWRLFIDILLLSPAHSYPLTLLSLTTHLALLSTRLPALISDQEDDPLFNDDWEASLPLYPRSPTKEGSATYRPPITLLVVSVGDNIFFDPSSEELAVADAVVALSIGISSPMNSVSSTHPDFTSNMDPDSELNGLLLLTLRTIDPPARQLAAATGEGDTQESDVEGIWKARRGGMKRKTITKMVRMVLDRGGVGEDVFKGLEGWF